MTGPEHYRAAEEILERAKAVLGSPRAMGLAAEDVNEVINRSVPLAQVHAMLAVAAMLEPLAYPPKEIREPWAGNS